MDLLISHLLGLGARREHLEAKVFGGGNVLPGISTLNVGERNAEFVLNFLDAEDIHVAAHDLVDNCARKVYFFPATGLVRVKRLLVLSNTTVRDRDVEYRRQLARLGDGDVD